MIDSVTGWFEISQYDDKRAISIANLVENMWLSRYPRPIEITYDQGSEFAGHEFIKSLMGIEYGITTKPSTPGKFHFECGIGTHSSGSRKPRTDL